MIYEHLIIFLCVIEKIKDLFTLKHWKVWYNSTCLKRYDFCLTGSREKIYTTCRLYFEEGHFNTKIIYNFLSNFINFKFRCIVFFGYQIIEGA